RQRGAPVAVEREEVMAIRPPRPRRHDDRSDEGVMGQPEDVGHVVVRAGAPAHNEHAVATELSGERRRSAAAFGGFFCRENAHRLPPPGILLCDTSWMA